MITDQEKQADLVAAAYTRELEIYQYQLNVDNYTLMLAALPSDDWPSAVAQYSGTAIEKLPASLSDTDVDTIAAYQRRDYLRRLLRTEKVQRGYSQQLLDVLKTQIGTDYDTLLTAYKASVAAQAAA